MRVCVICVVCVCNDLSRSRVSLSQQALAGRRLNTAASYLIILHQLEGPLASRRSAHKLLEQVLENDDLEVRIPSQIATHTHIHEHTSGRGVFFLRNLKR